MSDISQTELLEANNDGLQKKLHTALPAKVVSFNPDEQTVTIELMIQQMAHDGSMLELPPLVDVPVQMLSYGSFFISAEPKEGDEGLAHFAERCIDAWWESSKKSVPMDIRFHDFSDAFFAPGYKSKPNALMIVPNTLHMGTTSTYIRITEGGSIQINGNITVNGSIIATGDVQGAGISLSAHTHGGVQSGSSNTGQPQ